MLDGVVVFDLNVLRKLVLNALSCWLWVIGVRVVWLRSGLLLVVIL